MGKPRVVVNSGERYGRLTIVKEIENSRPRKILCKCDCGNHTTVLLSSLRNGNTRSCGCLSRELASKRVSKDLIGKRFGRLIVIKKVGTTKDNRVIWRCKCDCGNESDVITTALTSGNTTSCGCKVIETSKINARKLHSQRVDGADVFLLKKKPSKKNKMGVTGVYHRKTKSGMDRYIVKIGIKKKVIHIGTFDTLEKAVEARLEAEKKYHQPYIDKYRTNKHEE